MRRELTIATCLLFVAACGGGSQTTRVALSLYGGNISAGQTTCDSNAFGTAYLSIPGSKVTVTDQAGVIVGSTTVPTSGTVTSGTSPLGTPGLMCTFTFDVTVSDAPTFYTFQIGNMKGPTFSHDEMVANGWSVTLG